MKKGEELGRVVVRDIREIEIEDGFNPRHDTEPDEMLVHSIKRSGIREPIDIREKNGHAYVIDGERRLRAAQQLDMKLVPIFDHGPMKDADALIFAIDSGVGAKRLTERENTQAVRRLLDFNVKPEQIAAKLDIPFTTVKQLLHVEKKGTAKLKEAVQDGRISARAASKAAGLSDEQQSEVIVEASGKSVREQQRIVDQKAGKKDLLGGSPKPRSKAIEWPAKSATSNSDLYQLAPDAVERCRQIVENCQRHLVARSSSIELKTMLRVVAVIRGEQEVKILFEGM